MYSGLNTLQARPTGDEVKRYGAGNFYARAGYSLSSVKSDYGSEVTLFASSPFEGTEIKDLDSTSGIGSELYIAGGLFIAKKMAFGLGLGRFSNSGDLGRSFEVEHSYSLLKLEFTGYFGEDFYLRAELRSVLGGDLTVISSLCSDCGNAVEGDISGGSGYGIYFGKDFLISTIDEERDHYTAFSFYIGFAQDQVDMQYTDILVDQGGRTRDIDGKIKNTLVSFGIDISYF